MLFLFIYLVSVTFPEKVIRDFINDLGFMGPVVYVLLTLFSYIVAPLSATPVTYAGFYAFGANVIFLNTLATYISFVVNFWIARKWGRSIVKKLVGKADLARVDKLTSNYGLVTLVFVRIFQSSIGDFVSFAAGLTNMKFWPYLIISLIASVPGMLIWYSLSFYAKTPGQFVAIMLAVAGVFSAIFILGNEVKKLLKKRASGIN